MLVRKLGNLTHLQCILCFYGISKSSDSNFTMGSSLLTNTNFISMFLSVLVTAEYSATESGSSGQLEGMLLEEKTLVYNGITLILFNINSLS